jgi:hypothetical protein
MSSAAVVSTYFVPESSDSSQAQAPRVRVRVAATPTPAAVTSSHAITNPLWIIVIAMACFFGVMALVVGLG